MPTYPLERRYPLPLQPTMPNVWELWQRAKTLEWDPQIDIPWEELHPERYTAEQLRAAQLYWSRRTWGEYGAISESPALLLRFCLERRLPDLQFFFTMRTMEEGRHAEASWLMAERLGRYFPQPQNPPTVGAVGTHGVRRMAFDPETSLDRFTLCRCQFGIGEQQRPTRCRMHDRERRGADEEERRQRMQHAAREIASHSAVGAC